MTPGQYEFVRAIEAYKRVNKKLFPTWTEVLEVVEQLGYEKVRARSIDLKDVPDPLAGPGTREERASEHAQQLDGQAA